MPQLITTYYSNQLSVLILPASLVPKLWYLAENGAVYNAAGELTEWRDASGNGFTIVPNGGKAALSPERMNNHAMVRVTGKLATVLNCGIMGNMSRTVYFLGRLVTGSVLVSWGSSPPKNPSPLPFGTLCECMHFRTIPIWHAWGTNMDNRYGLPSQQVYNPALWAWRYNNGDAGASGGFSDFNENHGLKGGPPFMATVNTPFFMGWGDYYGSSTVDILEILVYDRFLTAPEDLQVRGYLGTKGNVPFV